MRAWEPGPGIYFHARTNLIETQYFVCGGLPAGGMVRRARVLVTANGVVTVRYGLVLGASKDDTLGAWNAGRNFTTRAENTIGDQVCANHVFPGAGRHEVWFYPGGVAQTGAMWLMFAYQTFDAIMTHFDVSAEVWQRGERGAGDGEAGS